MSENKGPNKDSIIIRFDDEKAENIDLLDKRVIWWDEKYICIRKSK